MASAATAEPESYAVVALVGDTISVVRHQPTSGTYVDQNFRQQFPTGSPHLDRLAAQVAIATIEHVAPGATVEDVQLTDRPKYDDLRHLGDDPGRLAGLIDTVRSRLKRSDTHYLVVLSKHRGDAQLRAGDGYLGSGKLTGLGFYLDGILRMHDVESGERGRGFIAPFAYVTATLVDLRTGAVVRSVSADEGIVRGNVRTDAKLDPWEALSAAQKARLLDETIETAVERAVPAVVSPS